MNSTKCPQCHKNMNESNNRLIQDACGHKKCRNCLLADETGCKTCKIVVATRANISCSTSVIKYDAKKSKSTLEHSSEEYRKLDESYSQIDRNSLIHVKKTDIIIDNNNVHKTPNHIKMITKAPLLYECTICSKSFRTAASVKYHSYCNGMEKPLKCNTCNKGFISRSHFESHKFKHSGVRPFLCVMCQKTFMQKSKLDRHMKLHTGEKPFICSECGKKFSNKDALNGHCRVHNGDKPYECKQCGNRFNNKSNLTKHIATHAKEKQYMCEECGKKFSNKCAIATHRKCHSSDRPYVCQTCSKGFTNIKDLKRHGIIHLDIKPYSCNICNTKFCRKDNLERHLKNTHSIKNISDIKSSITKTALNKHIVDSIAGIKIAKESKSSNNHQVVQHSKLPEILQENPNAIHVITNSCVPTLTNQIQNPANHMTSSIKNAVPVINGPFKLAFKTDAFKHNYNILNRTYTELPRIQTKKPYDMAESLNICQKILDPMSTTPMKPDHIDSAPKNVIMSVGKVNEKDSLEICKKILQPLDMPIPVPVPVPVPMPPIHYETSFEHEKHAAIKNMKFKLPSTYTNNAIKISENKEFPVEREKSASECNYIELQSMKFNYEVSNNCKQSVIVNSHSLELAKREHSFREIHWRRRTLQSLQPKMELL